MAAVIYCDGDSYNNKGQSTTSSIRNWKEVEFLKHVERFSSAFSECTFVYEEAGNYTQKRSQK